MDTESRVPPGFRFHPTDEELVDYYLKKKVASKRIDLDVIRDVDLYRLEPWDLQERCRIGYEEQTEWYFFSHKDKKYPTGTRTNRATVAGFWKATGRDKAIYAKLKLIGMRKTLVFYKGRAPNGQKTDWIMHEYRLETNENGAPQEEGWVVCRAFKKRTATQKREVNEKDFSYCYEDQIDLLPDQADSPSVRLFPQGDFNGYQPPFSCKQELDYQISHDPFLQLPQLESPKLPYNCNANSSSSTTGRRPAPECSMTNLLAEAACNNVFQEGVAGGGVHDESAMNRAGVDQRQMTATAYNEEQVTDWRVLDKFVASQLSQEDLSEADARFPNGSALMYPNISDMALLLARQSTDYRQPELSDYASSSNCTGDVDIWVFEK